MASPHPNPYEPHAYQPAHSQPPARKYFVLLFEDDQADPCVDPDSPYVPTPVDPNTQQTPLRTQIEQAQLAAQAQAPPSQLQHPAMHDATQQIQTQQAELALTEARLEDRTTTPSN